MTTETISGQSMQSLDAGKEKATDTPIIVSYIDKSQGPYEIVPVSFFRSEKEPSNGTVELGYLLKEGGAFESQIKSRAWFSEDELKEGLTYLGNQDIKSSSPEQVERVARLGVGLSKILTYINQQTRF